MIPVIDDNFKQICDEDLMMEEFDCAVKNLASDRSPGPEGITTDFYKHNISKNISSNLRPFTLLNTDNKIFTKVSAERLKTGISEIISTTQSGFLKGRSIHKNIRLVLILLITIT